MNILNTLRGATVVKPILTDLITLLKNLWDQHLQTLWNDLLLFIGSVGNTLLSFWNGVLAPLINWLVATFGPAVSQVFESVAGLAGTCVGVIADALDILLTALRGVLDFLTGVFRGDWTSAWNAIASTTLAVWERIKNGIRSAIDGILGFIQNLISSIQSAISSIGSFFSGVAGSVSGAASSLGQWFNSRSAAPAAIPQTYSIPYLAQGAVIPPNREFLAVLGDQSSGTNVEAPLSTIQQAVADVMQDYQDGNLAALEQVVAVLRQILEAVYGIHIGDEVIGQAVNRYTNKQSIITGRA